MKWYKFFWCKFLQIDCIATDDGHYTIQLFPGAPLILSPRMSVPTTAASLLSNQPTLDHSGLIYAAAPFTDYTNYAALAAGNPLLTDYADHTGGLFAR